jgi:hypothetical protein
MLRVKDVEPVEQTQVPERKVAAATSRGGHFVTRGIGRHRGVRNVGRGKRVR